MSILDKAFKFRANREPISTVWVVEDQRLYGSLTWDESGPALHLTLETELGILGDPFGADHPALRLLEAPLQPTIIGRTHEFDFITLDRCCQYKVETSLHPVSNSKLHKISLRPSRIWIGSKRETVEQNICDLEAYDTRLSGFFKSHAFVHYPFSEEKANIFQALGSPRLIWAFPSSSSPCYPIGKTKFELQIGMDATNMASSTTGRTVQSVTNVTIKLPDSAPMQKFSRILNNLEQALSVFSLENFSFQIRIYNTADLHAIALVWALGREDALFHPPMRHQILVDFSCQETLQKICSSWFGASQTVELSRWIFCQSLKETKDGIARFIGAAQAFEVLGKELGLPRGMSTTELQQITTKIRDALSNDHDASVIERITGLIQSSNRASFRDMLVTMIGATQHEANLTNKIDIAGFCKTVAETRNTLVHMENKAGNKLNKAFFDASKLSYKLCFWFALIQAHRIGIPLIKAQEFLLKNRNARRSLSLEDSDQ